jgi:hypothetical protein
MRIYFLETVIFLAASLLFALPLLQIEVQQVLLLYGVKKTTR